MTNEPKNPGPADLAKSLDISSKNTRSPEAIAESIVERYCNSASYDPAGELVVDISTAIIEAQTEAIKAAIRPRVFSDDELFKIAKDEWQSSAEAMVCPGDSPRYLYTTGFTNGMKRAASLNAIAAVEAAMPNIESIDAWARLEALHPNDWRDACNWLKAELLSRLKGGV